MDLRTPGGNVPVYDGNPAHLFNATELAFFPSTTTGLLRKALIGSVDIVQPNFTGGRIITGNRLAAVGVKVGEFQEKLAQDETLLKTEEQ